VTPEALRERARDAVCNCKREARYDHHVLCLSHNESIVERVTTFAASVAPPTGADTAGLRAALDRLLRLHLVECADETECGAVIEARAALAAPAPESNPQD
jgi:hypothetical protein